MTFLVDPDDTTPLFWDPIEHLKTAGEAEVFDLTVPGPESWFADRVVSHHPGAITSGALARAME